MIASAGGQAIGSQLTKGKIEVDPLTTIMGGVGSGVGSLVGAKVATNFGLRPVIGALVGKPLEANVRGNIVGAITEGVITGGAEKIAPLIEPHVRDIGGYIM